MFVTSGTIAGNSGTLGEDGMEGCWKEGQETEQNRPPVRHGGYREGAGGDIAGAGRNSLSTTCDCQRSQATVGTLMGNTLEHTRFSGDAAWMEPLETALYLRFNTQMLM